MSSADHDAQIASMSINATIGELSRYLDSELAKHTGPLRDLLNEKLADYAEWWLREGFAIAHRICVEEHGKKQPIDQIRFADDKVWLGPDKVRAVLLQAPMQGRPDSSWKI